MSTKYEQLHPQFSQEVLHDLAIDPQTISRLLSLCGELIEELEEVPGLAGRETAVKNMRAALTVCRETLGPGKVITAERRLLSLLSG